MANKLAGKRIAILVEDGFEQVELTEPKKALEQAGALAVIGHVERAWFCSMEWPGAGAFIQPFEDSLDKLLAGYPVGAAMEPFGQRYAELGADLSSELEEIVRGGPKNDALLTELWTNSHDARNYVVLGDPAVRLVPPEVKL